MSYYNYYQKKEKRKSEALEHFRKNGYSNEGRNKAER